MLYLWLKAVHVSFVVAWFAGLFYLPRLFVYHADARDALSDERFKIMERRLYALMTLAGSVAAVCGLLLVWLQPAWINQAWLQIKLALVLALVLYHIWCRQLLSAFAHGDNRHSGRWYRWFNEVPALLLFAIVALAILKPA
jgi:protoporphyrinogen IX oxidase